MLSDRFREHDLERAYLAVVAGAFPDDLTRIDQPVGGRRAVTHVAVRERFGERATLLACRLETGRTHQIRLHVVEVGHPVIGDARYGRPFAPAPPRMALHATRSASRTRATGAPLRSRAPWPPDLEKWLTETMWRNNGYVSSATVTLFRSVYGSNVFVIEAACTDGHYVRGSLAWRC